MTCGGGGGFAGATNRGIGNEGIFLRQGKEYEGYIFAKAEKPVSLRAAPRNCEPCRRTPLIFYRAAVAHHRIGRPGAPAQVTITVGLRDYSTGKMLASQQLKVAAATDWAQFNFSLIPTAGTDCHGIAPGSDPEVQCGQDCFNKSQTPPWGHGCMAAPPNSMAAQGHVCIKCAGEFVVGIGSEEGGSANVDYVFLSPGPWGRYKSGPFLKEGIQNLVDMGITSIRLGGSFTDPSYYFWKKWTGKPWERESLGAKWGSELISGFGPFEFIDMCAEAGIEPIVTTTAQWGDHMNHEGNTTCCSPEDMADLVEYTWGDSSTVWGKQRASDGHPEPYKVQYFELGNEQHNSLYPAQVKAMEERAAKIGKPKFFYYMSPNNAKWLTPTEAAEVEALGLGDHVVSDMHVGAGGGVGVAENMFKQWPGKTMGAVNAETNDGTHTMLRAVKEAADLNSWFDCSEAWCTRLKFRTASFCNERSGHFDAFDQGISFFLPNMTWLQPPGWVHQMYTSTWQPHGLNVTIAGPGGSEACRYYAYFADKGCRTWGATCTEAPWPNAAFPATLHKRDLSGSWPVIGRNDYCTEPTIFQDGPQMTSSDAECRQRCVSGQSNQGGTSSGPTVSAQKSADGKTIVVRLTNQGTKPVSVALQLQGGAWQTTGKTWTLSSANPLAANTPAQPMSVAPMAGTADTSSIALPAMSVVVAVVISK